MFHAIIQRKTPSFETTPCVIEKVVELTKAEYLHFSRCMLEDFDFIHEAAQELHHDSDGIAHGMLVLGYGYEDGIFVVSEGADYARYAAHIPDARALLRQEQNPELADFSRKMQELTEHYVQCAIGSPAGRRYTIQQAALTVDLPAQETIEHLLAEMLSQRPEISCVELVDNDICLTVSPEYALADDTSNLRRVTQDEADIICAKHTLWLLDAGGERADFSDCLLEGLNLSHRNLNAACFDNARLQDVNLHGAALVNASCVDAQFLECDLNSLTAEESNFLGARFYDCELGGAYFTHSDLACTVFQESFLYGGSLANCCLANADLGCIRNQDVNLRGVSYDHEAWTEDPDMGMTME